MKRLYLHIGMGKTGTTAVQRAFWHNRTILSSAGIAYPKIGAKAGAHHRISPFQLPHLKDLEGWTPLQPEEWAPLVQHLPEPVVFMSSELISASSDDDVITFCQHLLSYFDLRVCVYLRRQDDMLAAMYAQAVKGGVSKDPIEAMLRTSGMRLDYARRLLPWETAVGIERMVVRPYERNQFYKGDLLKDIFFHTLGQTDFPAGFNPDHAKGANSRLSLAATEFKRLINIVLPDRNDSKIFVEPLHSCDKDRPEAHGLTLAERTDLLARYAESNAEVARRYLGRNDGVLFMDEISAGAPRSRAKIGHDELTDVAGLILRTRPDLLTVLRNACRAADNADQRVKFASGQLLDAIDKALEVAEETPQPARVEITPESPNAGIGSAKLKFYFSFLRARLPKW